MAELFFWWSITDRQLFIRPSSLLITQKFVIEKGNDGMLDLI